MCIHPVQIPNPNYGRKSLEAFGKDVTSKFINVPCGHCHQCIAVRQMNWVQRIQMEGFSNYLFFCTLTYNNDALPVVTTSTGYDIRYADVSDVQKMFKRLRKRNAFGRPFRHFSVSELGSVRARPHFHIIFLVPKYDDDDQFYPQQLEKLMFDTVLSEWKRNVATPVWSEKKQRFVVNTRSPVWKPCCTYIRRFVRGKLSSTYDLHYVLPFASKNCELDVAFYVLKYMMKPSDKAERLRRALALNLPEDEFESVWSLVKPRHFESENFGLVSDVPPEKVLSWLRNCIQASKGNSDYPLFFNPVSGKSFPLARYYKNKGDILSVTDYFDFLYLSPNHRADNMFIQDHDLPSELTDKNKFDTNVRLVDLRSDSLPFDDLYD